MASLNTDFPGVSASAKMTLEQRYPIRYRKPSRVPAQFIIHGNRLLIRLFVRYKQSMLETFPGTNLTYADISESGIRKNWSGRFPLPWLADDGFERAHARASARVLNEEQNPDDSELSPDHPAVRVNVEFVRYGTHNPLASDPKQKYYTVRLSNGHVIPAHVSSPIYRWGWGFFRNFQIESLSLNWTVREPGHVTLQKTGDRIDFERIASHETGHILGLGDAYGANYRFFYEAPGTALYMMCHNRKVQPEELERVCIAHMTNHMQYFPWKFQRKTFFSGLKRAYQLQFHSITKKSKK